MKKKTKVSTEKKKPHKTRLEEGKGEMEGGMGWRQKSHYVDILGAKKKRVTPSLS